MAEPKQGQPSEKKRCPDCLGTGLKDDGKNSTAICDCPAGYRRTAAALWD